jgi:hypothetical protein
MHACFNLTEVVGLVIYMGLEQGMVTTNSHINVLRTMFDIKPPTQFLLPFI